MRTFLLLGLLLVGISSAHAEEPPRWVPGEGTHNHAPAAPRTRVRGGAVVGLLGGLGLTLSVGLAAGLARRDDVAVLAAMVPAGTLLLPLGASLGAALGGRDTQGSFLSAFGWSFAASVVTVGVPAALGLALATDPVGALLGGTLGLVLDLFVSPGFAILGFERSGKARLALTPLPSGFGGRF